MACKTDVQSGKTTRKMRETITTEETAVDDTATSDQIRDLDGTEIEVGTGAGTKGAMRAVTKSELSTSREDRECTERTGIEDAMTVTWVTKDLVMDIEEDASLTPDLRLGQSQGQDHLAARHTESVPVRTHLDIGRGALRWQKRVDGGHIAQRLTQIPSKRSLDLSHLHLNRLSARAVGVPSKATRWALILDSLRNTTPLSV